MPTFIKDYDPYKFDFQKSDKPAPLYFFSHGGANFADRELSKGCEPGAYDTCKAAGEQLKTEVKPDFVVVVSAHFKSDNPNSVEVIVPDGFAEELELTKVYDPRLGPDSLKSKHLDEKIEHDLMYDFFNFEPHNYRNQFHTFGNLALSNHVVDTLKENGFEARLTNRSLDHGVWVVSRVALGNPSVEDSGEFDLKVPLIQVSLTSSASIETHFKLGQALAKYRDYNGAFIFSGMSGHNLPEARKWRTNGGKGPVGWYLEPFNEILTQQLTKSKGDPEQLRKDLIEIETRDEWKDAYKGSHPTNEHLLPAIVAAGASRGDECKLLYSSTNHYLGWNFYRWG